MRRLFLVVAVVTTMAVPASAATFVLSSSASATSSVACKKISGTIKHTIKITSCTPKSKTNKLIKANATLLAGSTGTLTWTPSHQTTDVENMVTTSPGQGACKAGSTEEDTSGDVAGGTSTYTHAGDVISSQTCVAGSGKISLVPGTTMSL